MLLSNLEMKVYMALEKHFEQEQRVWGKDVSPSVCGVHCSLPIPQSLSYLPDNPPLKV